MKTEISENLLGDPALQRVVSEVPTETLRGDVLRQLFRGQPYRVFVERANGTKPRAVCEVALSDGDGQYKPIGQRMQFTGDGTEEAANIVAEYLAETKG